jgi:hypothetical protein
MGTDSLKGAFGRLGRLFLSTAATLLLSVSLVAGCSAQGSSPQGSSTEQGASPDMSLTDSISQLKAKAASGPVRVIVEVDRPATGDAAAIQAAKDRLEAVMQAAGVSQIDRIAGQPLMVMELNAEQLDDLAESGLVRSVQEDRPEGLY